MSYHESRTEENLVEFFISISKEVVSDSSRVYLFNSVVAILSMGSLLLLSLYCENISGKILGTCINSTNGLFLLIPPFTLAVVAMFPAFSDQTKKALAQKTNINDDRPLGSVFLAEFVFIIFWSLVMLFHNFGSTLVLKWAENSQGLLLAITLDILSGIWVFLVLSLAYEIVHSLKLLYLLILREYY